MKGGDLVESAVQAVVVPNDVVSDRQTLLNTIERLRLGPEPEGTVLVVDDNAKVRELIRRTLGRVGWTVVEATNGREALDWLAKRSRYASVRAEVGKV